jgi:hypothetical protein
VTGDWRKPQNEQLNDLHFSTNAATKSKKTRWAEDVARMDNRNTYLVLFGKPERNRSLGRIRHTWKYNIQTDLNLLKPTGYGMHQQVELLYALPIQYLCFLYFSENKQQLVPFTFKKWFYNRDEVFTTRYGLGL